MLAQTARMMNGMRILFVLLLPLSSCIQDKAIKCYRECKCKPKAGKAICTNKNLTFIPPLPSYVKNLDFGGNYLQQVTNGTFVNITNLKLTHLDLSDNNIFWLSNDAFIGLPYLGELTLSGNAQINFSSLMGSFYSLQKEFKLSLTLDSMNLTNLPDNFVQGLRGGQVTKISANNNLLKVFNEKAFQGLRNLQSIHLDNNKITRKTDIGIKTLRKITLTKNLFSPYLPLFCSQNRSDQWYPDLVTLDMQDNGVLYLEKESLSCLKKLQILHLDNNVITHLRNNTFSDLPNLTTLYLSGLPVRAIEPAAFNNSNLQTLYLEQLGLDLDRGNRKDFHFGSFFRWTRNLVYLVLSNNRFKGAKSEVLEMMFSPLTKLKTLVIQKVHLNYIPPEILYNLPALTSLNMGGNNIGTRGVGIFPNMTKLKSLFLQGNRITSITQEQLPPGMIKSLQEVNLADNPFACSCDNLWLMNWIRKKEIPPNRIKFLTYPDRYHCHSPPSVEGILLKRYNATEESCREVTSNLMMILAILSGSLLAVSIVSTILVYRGRWYIRYWWVKLKQKGYKAKEEALLQPDDFTYDAYVVYAEDNFGYVRRELLPLLEDELHFSLFIRDRDGEVGVAKVDDIVDNMDKSRRVLVVVSNSFLKDSWCEFQLDVARYRQIELKQDFIFLIKLQDIDIRRLSKSWCVLLTKTQTGVWSDEDELKRELFVAQIQTFLQRPVTIQDE